MCSSDLLFIELLYFFIYYVFVLHYCDLFDQLLVAQASTLDVPLVTSDSAFDAYDIVTIWD